MSTAGAASPTLERTVAQRAGSVIVAVVMVVLVALAGAVVVVPRVIGAVPLTVLTGSMQPLLAPGDLVVVRPVAPEDLAIGDVVTFQPVSDDPTLVTHRITAIAHDDAGAVTAVTTRGDANGRDDDPLVPAQVKGRLVYSLPWVGHLTRPSRAGAAVVAVAGTGLLAYAAVLMFLPDKRTPENDAVPQPA